MKHESILFLHLFFCFKINIWFLGEFVNYRFNWIAGLLTVMWTLEHGDTFRGSSFFPFLVANLRTPLPTFWRVCNYNHGWIACRIEHCKAQQWGIKLYDIIFRLNNLQPQNLFFFILHKFQNIHNIWYMYLLSFDKIIFMHMSRLKPILKSTN